MSKIDCSIIIPVYQSQDFIAESVASLFEACRNEGLRVQILLCEDGKCDQSRNILRALEKTYPQIGILYNDRNYGLGYTLRKLIAATSSEHIIYCDIDLPFGAEGVLSVFKMMGQADVVVASRYAGQENNVAFLRKFFSRLYWMICRLGFGVPIKDIGSGTVGFCKSKIVPLELKSNGFGIHAELYAKAVKRKLSVKEVGLPSRHENAATFSVLKHSCGILKNLFVLWRDLKHF